LTTWCNIEVSWRKILKSLTRKKKPLSWSSKRKWPGFLRANQAQIWFLKNHLLLLTTSKNKLAKAVIMSFW
jgi:hypothetical protein